MEPWKGGCPRKLEAMVSFPLEVPAVAPHSSFPVCSLAPLWPAGPSWDEGAKPCRSGLWRGKCTWWPGPWLLPRSEDEQTRGSAEVPGPPGRRLPAGSAAVSRPALAASRGTWKACRWQPVAGRGGETRECPGLAGPALSGAWRRGF